MANFDAAVETPLAESRSSLDGEIASFGTSKTGIESLFNGASEKSKVTTFRNLQLHWPNVYIPVTGEALRYLPKSKPGTRRENNDRHTHYVPEGLAVRNAG